MLHLHGIRQTVDGKPDVIYVDESRTVKFEEASRECWSKLKVFELLKCLRQGEKMSNLKNAKVIILVQWYVDLYLPWPENLQRCHTKSWYMEGNQHKADYWVNINSAYTNNPISTFPQWFSGRSWRRGPWCRCSCTLKPFVSTRSSLIFPDCPSCSLFSWCSQGSPIQSQSGGGGRQSEPDVRLRMHQPGFSRWWGWRANYRYLLCE